MVEAATDFCGPWYDVNTCYLYDDVEKHDRLQMELNILLSIFKNIELSSSSLPWCPDLVGRAWTLVVADQYVIDVNGQLFD